MCIYLDLLIVDLIFNKELKDRRENLKKYKKRSKQPKISFYFFDNQDFLLLLSIYIKRIQKVSYYFFFVKNTLKLINQQLKNGVKIVNLKKKLVIAFFIVKNTPT